MVYEVPDDRYYAKTHEWIKLEGEKAVIGLTSYAIEELGDITYLEVKPVGSLIHQGEPLGLVESSKTTEKIYAPISGEILEINKNAGIVIEDSDEIPIGLEVISEDPYRNGWVVKLSVKGSLENELKNLMKPEEYRKALSEENA